MKAPREDISMLMYPDNPACEVGDVIRLRADAEWKGPKGEDVIVPAGALGTVKAYRSAWGDGLAIDFGIFSHPQHGVFPLALHVPGRSRYSNDIELINRKTVPHDHENLYRSRPEGSRAGLLQSHAPENHPQNGRRVRA